MKFAAALLIASTFLSLYAEVAQAGEIIYIRRYRATAEERAKEHRHSVAERAYQIKAMKEVERVNAERERLTAKSTVKYYGKQAAQQGRKPRTKYRRTGTGNDQLVRKPDQSTQNF